MPTHAGSSNEATVGEVLELLAMHACSFHLLASPVRTGGLGAIVSAVEIGGNDFAIVVNFTVEHRPLRPRDTGVGDEDIETAIEFLDYLVDRFLNVLGIGDIDLVCLA